MQLYVQNTRLAWALYLYEIERASGDTGIELETYCKNFCCDVKFLARVSSGVSLVCVHGEHCEKW